jgi:hypothetical protein
MNYDSFDAVLHWIFRSVSRLLLSVQGGRVVAELRTVLPSSAIHVLTSYRCIDTRRRLVQTLRREHFRRCMPQGGSWRLSSIPL